MVFPQLEGQKEAPCHVGVVGRLVGTPTVGLQGGGVEVVEAELVLEGEELLTPRGIVCVLLSDGSSLLGGHVGDTLRNPLGEVHPVLRHDAANGLGIQHHLLLAVGTHGGAAGEAWKQVEVEGLVREVPLVEGILPPIFTLTLPEVPAWYCVRQCHLRGGELVKPSSSCYPSCHRHPPPPEASPPNRLPMHRPPHSQGGQTHPLC